MAIEFATSVHLFNLVDFTLGVAYGSYGRMVTLGCVPPNFRIISSSETIDRILKLGGAKMAGVSLGTTASIAVA